MPCDHPPELICGDCIESGGRKPAARNAVEAMGKALAPESPNEWRDLAEPYEPLPPKTWPSTLAYIDTHCGGFYGVTTIAAEKGSGKSMLARGSSIEAAASGLWQVVLFVAENDYDGFREGFNTYLDVNPHAVDCLGNLHFLEVGRGQTPESLTIDARTAIDTYMDCPVLIVMDSINSIVNLSVALSARNYLSTLREFALWAMHARRLSGGDVSFLIVSETNKRGHAKGEDLPSWSDLYLQMKNEKKSEHIVSMRLDKTRRTGGAGPMGKYVRQWGLQRFASPHEQTELKLVQGGASEGEPF